jgi:hypothetical protein
MPLELHAQAKRRLKELVADGLRSVHAKNGMFIERSSVLNLIVADLALPQTGKLHDRLIQYIDEFPLTDFVTETIGQELYEIQKYLPDQTVALTEIAEYKDATATASRLVDDFDTLPWTYRVSIPLSESLKELIPLDQDAIELAPAIRLVRPSDKFVSEFPLEHPNSQRAKRLKEGASLFFGLLDTDRAEWNTERIYLQMACDGFIGQYGGSGTAHTTERMLRSFCGTGIATRLFKFELSYSPTPWKTSAYVHRRLQDDTWSPVTRYELGDAIARGLAGLKLHDLDGWIDLDVKRQAWTYARLQDIAAVFSSGARSEQILLAAQWLFDSFSGQDQLLSFVQSMVVLEILLGDKSISDEIGIGELISNRFAYLIGTTHDERTELLAEFKKIYRVRSQIVHSGKHKLSFSEYSLFSRLRWMCRRVIDKEVELLKAGIVVKKPTDEQIAPSIPASSEATKKSP